MAVKIAFRRLGQAVPQRLHRSRARELVRALSERGYELQRLDGTELSSSGDVRLGILDKVRLRLAAIEPAGSTPSPGLASISIGNFKSFVKASLPLSKLTLLIGANASGKSNALEALQLMSWMSQGRRLSSLLAALNDRELAVRGNPVDFTWSSTRQDPIRLGCTLAPNELSRSLVFGVELRSERDGLRVVGESLRCPEEAGNLPLYQVVAPAREHGREMDVEYNNFARGRNKPRLACIDEQPVFVQLVSPARFGATHKKSQEVIPRACKRLGHALEHVLFLDPVPSAMRGYSFKDEQRLAGDGSNLSGVLYHLTEDRRFKDLVLDFVRSLPEQDILDLSYLEGPRGEVMVCLRETFRRNDEPREAALLSDGTLRVLAIAAALLSVDDGALVVIEEIDNGVHPSRARDLLERIEDVACRRQLRILLTTHNPALLDALPRPALPDVVACYRDPSDGSSRLIRLEELSSYPELVAKGPLGRVVTRGDLERHLKEPLQPEDRREQALDWVRQTLEGSP